MNSRMIWYSDRRRVHWNSSLNSKKCSVANIYDENNGRAKVSEVIAITRCTNAHYICENENSSVMYRWGHTGSIASTLEKGRKICKIRKKKLVVLQYSRRYCELNHALSRDVEVLGRFCFWINSIVLDFFAVTTAFCRSRLNRWNSFSSSIPLTTAPIFRCYIACFVRTK